MKDRYEESVFICNMPLYDNLINLHMRATSITLCSILATGLMIGALSFYYPQHTSAQMGMINPNMMMNRTGMMGMGNMMNPGMMGNMMNPGMMGNMMNPGMMGNMMNPGMMGNMINPGMMGMSNMMNPGMMGMSNMMNPGMMGMGSMMMNGMFESQNITSSVKLLPAMMNGISSQVKISLGEAVMNAQKELGNSSHAVAANIGEEHGYLVYTIWGIDPDMNLQKIVIDPGNGKVLFSQKLSTGEMMGLMMKNSNMMGSPMNHDMMGNFWH